MGQVGAGSIDGLGDIEQVAFGVEAIDNLHGAGEVLVGQVPDPGGSVAEDDAALGRLKPRRSASRMTRRTKGAGSGSVSRLATVSMALQVTESLPNGDAARVEPFTGPGGDDLGPRVLAEPSGCLPWRPSRSDRRTGTPVPKAG